MNENQRNYSTRAEHFTLLIVKHFSTSLKSKGKCSNNYPEMHKKKQSAATINI